MKLHVNGLHISAAIVSLVLWRFWLPAWPSLFIFVIGQFAATYLTSALDFITKEGET